MASTPNYSSTPGIGAAVCAAALGGTRTTPTGGSTIVTGTTNGVLVSRIVVQLIGGGGASSANVAAVYLYDGANFYLRHEEQMSATSPSATVAAAPIEIPFTNLIVPTGWTLVVGIRTRASAVDDTSIVAHYGGL